MRACTSVSLTKEFKLIDTGFPDFLFATGFFGAWKALGSAGKILLPWTPEDVIAQIKRLGELIDEVRPDLVICDPLYLIGRDACRWKDQKTVILSPNTVKEHVAHVQGAKALWMWGG